MPSAIRKHSSGSVIIFSVDEQIILESLERYVEEIHTRPEVVAVVVFGSFGAPRFGVGSDVDLLLLLRDSHLRFLDRTPIYQPDSFPVDIDVFPYTLEEVKSGQPIAQEALTTGQALWQQAEIDLQDFQREDKNISGGG